MGFLSFSRPNKKARVDSSATSSRPSSLFAPVLSDWLDSSSPPRQLEPLSPKNKTTSRRISRSFSQITIRRRASTVTTISASEPPIEPIELLAERTVPGTHPIGTPRTKMTGRRPMSNYTVTSLPPGAAAPAFGSVLDYDLNDTEYFSRPSIHLGPDDRVRCMSMSLDSYSATPVVTAANNNKRPFSIMSRPSVDGAPVVPPRSHLRGFPSSSTAPSSTYSKVSLSSSSSPMASGRNSPERPFVLAVEPPSGNFGSLTDEPEVEEIINFRPGPQRKTSVDQHCHNGRPISGNRDPLKIRDQRPPRKSTSGVYTPPSFPGPHGSRPSPSHTFPSPTSPTSPQPGSPDSAPQGIRARTFSGFKRISAAVSPTSVQPAPQLPNRTSQYPRPAGLIYAPMAALPYAAPPLPVRPPVSSPQTPRSSTQTPRTSTQTPRSSSHSSHGSRDSYSPPSSSQSVKSVSPPTTPTTPSLLSADRGKVVIAGDSSEDELPPPLGLDLEPTPKPSPRSEPQPLVIKGNTSVAEDNVPLSPTAPKRARRKPVPRLEDDLVTRLEAIEV